MKRNKFNRRLSKIRPIPWKPWERRVRHLCKRLEKDPNCGNHVWDEILSYFVD